MVAAVTKPVNIDVSSLAELNTAIGTVNASTDAKTSYLIQIQSDIALGNAGPQAITSLNSISPVVIDGTNGNATYTIDGGNGGSQTNSNNPSCGFIILSGNVALQNLTIQNTTSSGANGSMGAGGAVFVGNFFDIQIPGAPSGNAQSYKYGNGQLVAAATQVLLNNLTISNSFAIGSNSSWTGGFNAAAYSGGSFAGGNAGFGSGGSGGANATMTSEQGNGGNGGFGGGGGGGGSSLGEGPSAPAGNGGNAGYGGGGGFGGGGGNVVVGNYGLPDPGGNGGAGGFGGSGGGGGGGGAPAGGASPPGGTGGGVNGYPNNGPVGGHGDGSQGGQGGPGGDNSGIAGFCGYGGGSAGFGGAIFVMSGASLLIQNGISFTVCYASTAGAQIFFQGNGSLEPATLADLRALSHGSSICDELYAVQNNYVAAGLTPTGQNPTLGPDGLPSTGGTGNWGFGATQQQ